MGIVIVQNPHMNSILITGAQGQIGSDLVVALRERYGSQGIVESDLQSSPPAGEISGPHEILDVRDADRLQDIVDRYRVDTVFHLASLLSANGEHRPDLCWDVNINGLRNVLEIARSRRLRVFWPSSIAVFGPATPRMGTPQTTILDPVTLYGITKVAGESLCRYYAQRWGVDVRSLRFPGIISYSAPPGGGTTDYAVAMFYSALEEECYTCFVRPDTRLPMMYMPDAVRSILSLMDAEADAIGIRTSYNVAALSFSAQELEKEIRRHVPGFRVEYRPDFRQDIADSWPTLVDDSAARKEWGWQHAYDLPSMVEDMLAQLARRVSSDTRTVAPLPH
jgi:nucleoside-diphosphate-sugar epimerase